MQIISYLNYEDAASPQKKEKHQKTTFLETAVVMPDEQINAHLITKYSKSNTGTTGKKLSGIKHAKFILTIVSLLLSMSIFALVLASFFTSKLPLARFELSKLSDANSALQEYLFPAKEEVAIDAAALANLHEFLSEVSFQTYTVSAGDTISGIAYKFGLHSIGSIIALNDISNVKKLRVGEKLTIPSIDGLFHTVRKGENLAYIAGKYGLSINNILDANDLKNEVITIGQKLFIPGAQLSNFELKKALGELFIYPIRGRLTSYFGYRRDPINGLRSFHNGLDIANRLGTPVQCIMDGKVIEVGYSSIYGNYIIIVHDGGYQSLYGHLHSIFVRRGAYVSQGTRIASVGSTGRSTGPHLHLSIYRNGKLIDPLSVLEK